MGGDPSTQNKKAHVCGKCGEGKSLEVRLKMFLCNLKTPPTLYLDFEPTEENRDRVVSMCILTGEHV